MDNYIPTTEQVRHFYVQVTAGDAEFGSESVAEFNRWLAEHDRQIAEQIWDERGKARGQYLGPDYGHHEDCMGWEDCHCESYPNPYRKGEVHVHSTERYSTRCPKCGRDLGENK